MEKRTYRAALSAYAVFGLIAAALSVLWLVAVWRSRAPWLPLAVPLGGFATIAVWLSFFRVTFAPDELVLGRPFRRVRRIPLGEILSVEFAEQTGRSESPMTLSIRTSFGEELRLNAKIFSHEVVQRLLALPSTSPGPRRQSPMPR